MRAGRTQVTYKLIAKAIGLPAGNEIVAVVPQTADEVGSRCLSVIISGADMPNHLEGTPLVLIGNGEWK